MDLRRHFPAFTFVAFYLLGRLHSLFTCVNDARHPHLFRRPRRIADFSYLLPVTVLDNQNLLPVFLQE